MIRPALAAIYGVILAVVIIALVGPVLIFVMVELFFDDLRLYDLDAYLDDDKLYVKVMLENRGDVRIEEVLIDRIEVSDLVIDQKRIDADGLIGEYPVLRLYNVEEDVKYYCSSVCLFEGKPGYASEHVDEHSGFSLANGALTGALPSGIGPGEKSEFILSLSNSPDDSYRIDLSGVVGSKLKISLYYYNGDHNLRGPFSTIVR